MPIPFLIEKLIFRPVKLNPDFQFHFELKFEELTFYPEPEITINAIHFKVENSNGIILYFHGNKDNLARWGTIASKLTKFNYDVIIIDYRGYGKSKGIPSEVNLFNDALFCYHKIIEDFKPLKMVLYGRSLGTGVASWLAGMINPNQLILETPYYNMHDLVSKFVPQFLLKNNLHFKLTSHSYLKNTLFPILIFHGTKDEIVPYNSGKKLFESLKNPYKKLVTLTAGKHNNLSTFPQYWNELEQFLK